MQKKMYCGVEIIVRFFDKDDVIVASGESEFVPEVSTGPNDLPIMPAG